MYTLSHERPVYSIFSLNSDQKSMAVVPLQRRSPSVRTEEFVPWTIDVHHKMSVFRIPPTRKLLTTFTWKRVYYCFNRANTLMFGMIEQVRTTGPVTTCDVYKWIRHSPVSQSLGKKSRFNFAIVQLSESLIPRDKAPTGSSAVISFPNHGK